jgi:hypothetical protein
MTQPDDWNAWVERDMAFATATLLDTGRVNPMFILHTQGDELMVVGTQFTSDKEKEMAQLYVQLICVAHDVKAFSFVGEAWMRLMSREIGESEAEMNKRAFSVRPSEATDRKEIITVTLVYRDEEVGERKTIGAMAEIVRDADGKATAVNPMDMPADSVSSGAIPKILPRERPNARQRQTAQDLLDNMPAFKTR